jgi:hypothetical protein
MMSDEERRIDTMCSQMDPKKAITQKFSICNQ